MLKNPSADRLFHKKKIMKGVKHFQCTLMTHMHLDDTYESRYVTYNVYFTKNDSISNKSSHDFSYWRMRIIDILNGNSQDPISYELCHGNCIVFFSFNFTKYHQNITQNCVLVDDLLTHLS